MNRTYRYKPRFEFMIARNERLAGVIMKTTFLYSKLNSLDEEKQKIVRKYSHIDDSFNVISQLVDSLSRISTYDFARIQDLLNTVIDRIDYMCIKEPQSRLAYAAVVGYIIDRSEELHDTRFVLCHTDDFGVSYEVTPVYANTVFSYCKNDLMRTYFVYADKQLIKTYIDEDSALKLVKSLEEAKKTPLIGYAYYIN
jgi:hypothetical protein